MINFVLKSNIFNCAHVSCAVLAAFSFYSLEILNMLIDIIGPEIFDGFWEYFEDVL